MRSRFPTRGSWMVKNPVPTPFVNFDQNCVVPIAGGTVACGIPRTSWGSGCDQASRYMRIRKLDWVVAGAVVRVVGAVDGPNGGGAGGADVVNVWSSPSTVGDDPCSATSRKWKETDFVDLVACLSEESRDWLRQEVIKDALPLWRKIDSAVAIRIGDDLATDAVDRPQIGCDGGMVGADALQAVVEMRQVDQRQRWFSGLADVERGASDPLARGDGRGRAPEAEQRERAEQPRQFVPQCGRRGARNYR